MSRDPNPFLRYRRFLASYDRAEDDAHFVDVVTRLDKAVAAVDGRGFTVTPFRWADSLGVWVKDETGNVAGSHKGRHLMGLAIWLEIVGVEKSRQLAIASCGNAAVAAAVIARCIGSPAVRLRPDVGGRPRASRDSVISARSSMSARGKPPTLPGTRASIASARR